MNLRLDVLSIGPEASNGSLRDALLPRRGMHVQSYSNQNGRPQFAKGDDMITTLHVLSIGSVDSNGLVRDILLSRTGCQLLVATCVWDLSGLLTSGKIDVAILHSTLSPGELRSCAVYIRHHWPETKILLVHEQAEILDDPMYDERIPPESSAKGLFTMIERLGAYARRGTRNSMNPTRTKAPRKGVRSA